MKKFLLILLSFVCVFACLCLSACGNDGNDEEPQTPSVGTEDSENTPSNNNSEQNAEDDRTGSTMYIKIGNTTLTATLVDNSATKALKERLKTSPITINMSDYGGWEKVGGLGFDLPTSNQEITAQPCEFVLYQGNQLVIFYGSNSWSYTRLGKIEGVSKSELKEILGDGDVAVTLSLING